MKQGFFIIKPDLFDSKEMLNYLMTHTKQNFDSFELYVINQYGKFCKEYREYDIANTEMQS